MSHNYRSKRFEITPLPERGGGWGEGGNIYVPGSKLETRNLNRAIPGVPPTKGLYANLRFGFLAYDRIMDFPGRFVDHILPEKIQT